MHGPFKGQKLKIIFKYIHVHFYQQKVKVKVEDSITTLFK